MSVVNVGDTVSFMEWNQQEGTSIRTTGTVSSIKTMYFIQTQNNDTAVKELSAITVKDKEKVKVKVKEKEKADALST